MSKRCSELVLRGNTFSLQSWAVRDPLKGIMQKEIEKLAETLEAMEPKVSLNVTCKLMPFVFPKVQTVTSSLGENFNTSFWQ